MEWWVWGLIGIGVIAIGAIKLTVFSRIMRKRKQKKRFSDD